MTPKVVVDIGNTRIKWGKVARTGHSLEKVDALPPHPDDWEKTLATADWKDTEGDDHSCWVVASVQPKRADALCAWLTERGQKVSRLEKAAQIPLRVALEHPDRAGIDRLLNAVAARKHLAEGQEAVLVDAGSAITIDWLDGKHVFRGGSILPGLDLMAEALHRYTALLPRVEVRELVTQLPGTSTTSAIQTGLYLSVVGAIREAVSHYAARAEKSLRIFLTGGQSPAIAKAMGLSDPVKREPPWENCLLWPEQTLMGILMSVEGLA
ncbi:MAG: type III pantothenate kinase [Gemmataceae bacterium]